MEMSGAKGKGIDVQVLRRVMEARPAPAISSPTTANMTLMPWSPSGPVPVAGACGVGPAVLSPSTIVTGPETVPPGCGVFVAALGLATVFVAVALLAGAPATVLVGVAVFVFAATVPPGAFVGVGVLVGVGVFVGVLVARTWV